MRIADLTKEREQFIADEMRKQAAGGQDSFDTAVRRAIRDQAKSKGFMFNDGC